MKRKLLSVMLSIAMAVTMISITTNIYAQNFTDWTVLTDGGALNAGNYYLERDVTLTNNIVFSGGDVTLDLNGYVLKGNGNGSVIKVNGGNLTIQDSNPNNTHTGDFASLPAGGCITGGIGTSIGSEYLGGGIYIVSGSLVMNGGTIYSCNADKGGGVFTWGNFTMNNSSAIVDCNARIDGAGVCACNCLFIMNGSSKISNCLATNGGGGVYTWADSSNTASFTMNDNSIIENCRASANYSSNKRNGGGVCVENSTFTLENGKITGNTSIDGGGVHVYSGTFNMTGGTISDNVANHCGGGVNVQGTFNMTGGTIEYNRAIPDPTDNFYGGGGAAIYNNGKGTLSGGEIQYNSSTVRGGGILILYTNESQPQNISLTSVSITNNTATTGGGGVYFDNEKVALKLGKNACIKDNVLNGTVTKNDNGYSLTGGTKNNLHFDRGETLTLVENSHENMCVGVTTRTAPSAGNPVQLTTNGTEDDVKYFASDNGNYGVTFKNGHLVLDIPLTITYKDQGDSIFSGTNVSELPTTFMAGISTQLKNATKAGFAFGGWFVNADCTDNPITVLDGNYTDNLTLYAKWTEIKTIADVLSTNPSFPLTYASGWVSDKYRNAKVFCSSGNFEITDNRNTIRCVASTTNVGRSGDNYVWDRNSDIFTFYMSNGMLTGVSYYSQYGYKTLIGNYYRMDSSFVVEYRIIEGNDISINVYDNKDVSFISDADFEKFSMVIVNNEVIDSSNYIVEQGSTKVTLKASYLAALPNGEYTLEIISTDGQASTNFTIVRNEPSLNTRYIIPNTGVGGTPTNNHSLLKISSLSLLAIGTYMAIKKKKDN